MTDHDRLTDSQLEAAARRLCTLRNVYAANYIVEIFKTELRAHLEREEAIRRVMGGSDDVHG